MNEQAPSKEQVAFEAWLDGPPTSPDSPYSDTQIRHLYEAWCAAWKARAENEPRAGAPDQGDMDQIFDSWFNSLREPPQNYLEIFAAGYAAGLSRTAQPPRLAPEYSKLCDAIQQAMRHAHVPDMQTDDGSDYQFVDLMSDQDGTIATGERRIEIFAERIAEATIEHLDMPALTKGSAP
jgi:hypothetical protein